jgi:hypothetical protein
VTPEQALSALDRTLEQHGERVILRRLTGAAPQAWFDAPVRARVAEARPTELAGQTVQMLREVVISPTALVRAGWPGPVAEPGPPGTAFLPRSNDRVVIDGVEQAIEAVDVRRIGDVPVRINLAVHG